MDGLKKEGMNISPIWIDDLDAIESGRHFGLGTFGRRACISYLHGFLLFLFINLAVFLISFGFEDCIHCVMGG